MMSSTKKSTVRRSHCFIHVQHSITTFLGIRVSLHKRVLNLSLRPAPVIHTLQLKVEEVIRITRSALITTVTSCLNQSASRATKKKMRHVASASHFSTMYEERNQDVSVVKDVFHRVRSSATCCYTVTVSVSTKFLLLLFMSFSTDLCYGVCDSMVLFIFLC